VYFFRFFCLHWYTFGLIFVFFLHFVHLSFSIRDTYICLRLLRLLILLSCLFSLLLVLLCFCNCTHTQPHPLFGGDMNGICACYGHGFLLQRVRERWRKFCNRNFGYQRTQFERVGMRRDVSNRRCCGMHDRPLEVLSIRVFKPHPSEFQLGNYKCAH